MEFFNTQTILKKISIKFSSYQVLATSFAGLILTGALLLMLPISTVSGESMRFIDALFTATSAVCVTGLIVVDTGRFFSLFGQLVVISLIQLGAIGVMTGATMIYISVGKKIDLRQRMIMQDSFSQDTTSGMVRLTRVIIKYTFIIEFIFGTILAFHWYEEHGLKAIYYGYWHAVSAFANAGFDLFGNFQSLTRYVDDPVVNFSICSLIVLGGLGFSVMTDIVEVRRWRRLKLHTKLVVVITTFLITFGAFMVFLLEYNNPLTMEPLSLRGKILSAFFQSITARTAGFNSLNLSDLQSPTLIVLTCLMFIGGSPASVAGGIKTTTFAVIVISIWAMIRGKDEAVIAYRKLSNEVIKKSFMIFTLFATCILFITFLIITFDGGNFLFILFETTSAFGTVGLSCGLTPTFSDGSKLALIISMFLGRVGLLTFMFAILHNSKQPKISYPAGKIIVG